MDSGKAADIARWVTEAGLTGMTELELLHGFCHRLVAGGVPIARVNIVIDTLHPIHEGASSAGAVMIRAISITKRHNVRVACGSRRRTQPWGDVR
jgi:hypothetical protein